MKLRIATPKKTMIRLGGGDDPKPLTPQMMAEWNQFLDYVKAKGLEGSKDLDSKDKGLGQKLFNEFKSANPNITIDYTIVPSVQSEIQKLKQSAQSFAARRGDANAQNIMKDASKVDGWFGSKTSQYRFPDMKVKELHNNQVVGVQNLGLVNSQLKPTGANASIMAARKTLPSGAKLEPLYDAQGKQNGLGYTDENGDIIRVN